MNHVEAVASQTVQDVIDYVKNHPQYGHIIEALGIKALQVLADEAGVAL